MEHTLLQFLYAMLQAEVNAVQVPLWVVGTLIGLIQAAVAWFLRSLVSDVRELVKQNNEQNIKFAVLSTEVSVLDTRFEERFTDLDKRIEDLAKQVRYSHKPGSAV